VHICCSNVSKAVTTITMHMVARALALAAGRRRGGADDARYARRGDWHPKKGVVCCAIAIAAVQHAQDADAGPRLQLASSRQSAGAAQLAAAEQGQGRAGARRAAAAGAHIFLQALDSNTMSNDELRQGKGLRL
jgi:hypothetical protein